MARKIGIAQIVGVATLVNTLKGRSSRVTASALLGELVVNFIEDAAKEETELAKPAAAVKPVYDAYSYDEEIVDGYFTQAEIDFMKRWHTGLPGKLDAVRLVRNRTGFSLMDAKNYVEKHGADYLNGSR